MIMDIEYSVEKKGDVVVFTIQQKEVNHNNAASLKEKLFLEIADGNSKIVLDMKNVTEMDSSGMGALLFGKRQANNAGGDLVLVSVAPAIQSMMRIAQLSRVFEIFSGVSEAVKSFR